MRKLILILSAVIFFATTLYSQNSRWSIDVGAGAAIPTGKFGSKNIYDSAASFANLGPAINISLDYKLTKYFGLTFLLTGQQNNVDMKTIDEKWEEASTQKTLINASSNNWHIGKIMTAGFISLPLDKNEKIYFTTRIMAGVLKTNGLKFSLFQTNNLTDSFYLSDPPTSSYISEKKSLNWAFVYLAGVGLKYNVNKKIYLLSTFDYSASTLKFPSVSFQTTKSAGGVTIGIEGIGRPPVSAS